MEYPESSLIRKEPCPECGSKDNLARYSDGHAHCFSFGCGYREKGDGTVEDHEDDFGQPERPSELLRGEYKALKARGITEETCKLFGYSVGRMRNEIVQIANYHHPETRKLCGQKIRTKDKDFITLGKHHSALFGWQLWTSGGKKLVITEGEIDALSVSQAQGNKYPVVSLPNGASSVKKAILANKEYLKKFDDIVLMFDMDEPGRLAADEAARLIGSKALIAELPMKDANEVLLNLGPEAIIKAVWGAQPRRVAGLYSGTEVMAMGDTEPEWGLSWPWPTMTAMTYGKRPHEMILVGAGTGCGKTDWMKEDIAHNIMVHGEKCMSIFLEEPNLGLTLNTIAGKVDGELYHIPGREVDIAKREATKAHIAKFLYMFKVEDTIDPADVLELIRDAVEGYGVKHVYLDHVTYLLDASGEGDLAATKKLMRGLNDLNKALPFTLYYVAHLRKKDQKSGKTHEEGGRITLDDFAGGKVISQYANFAIGLERSQQGGDDEVDKDETTLRGLKDRYTGAFTGVTIPLRYNPKTGQKREVDPFDIASATAEPEGNQMPDDESPF